MSLIYYLFHPPVGLGIQNLLADRRQTPPEALFLISDADGGGDDV